MTSTAEGPDHHPEVDRVDPGLALVDDVPDWIERALCAQTDPEAFFPEKGGSTRQAKEVCLSCLVRAECLDWAMDHDERFGIWGGLSARERRRLKRHGTETPADEEGGNAA